MLALAVLVVHSLRALVPALVSTRREYQGLFSIYVPIAVGVFAVILLVTLGAVLSGVRRPRERAARWHENNPLEGTYALLLALVVVFLLYETFTREHRVDTVAQRERPALSINVTAAKWEWQFNYPGYGIIVRSGTDGTGTLVVPVGEAIRFRLRSIDVIHAFWIPELRYKHDLIAGSTQVATLTFTRPGRFPGQCAEFCGLRHADMVYVVRALPPAQFAAWARSARGRA